MEEGQTHTLPAPQLVMLANVAAVTSAEGAGCDGSVADEKEMMELKTVGCSYSDSEDESIIRLGAVFLYCISSMVLMVFHTFSHL